MLRFIDYLKLAFSFLRFKLVAKPSSGHGIHSPLVYSFSREVLNSKETTDYIQQVNQLRQILSKSSQPLNASAFGAGSRLGESSLPVGTFIRNTSVTPKWGEFLYRLARWANARHILELGTSMGISTLYLAGSEDNPKVVTIEGDSERAQLAKQNFAQMNRSNIQLMVGDFHTHLPKALDTLGTLDMVFFDGNHSSEPTLLYLKQCLEYTHTNSIFIFDDIRWSPEMFRTWKIISNHSCVTVSIDLFKMGVIFFRKDIPKQHFVINF